VSRVALKPADRLDVEVEIGDCVFTPVVVTRTRSREIRDLDGQFAAVQSGEWQPDENADHDVHDEMARLIGAMLDVWLEPEAGKRKKPSAVIDQMWKGEQVTMPQLIALLEDIAEAAGRPT
jgi:hypothetical protein